MPDREVIRVVQFVYNTPSYLRGSSWPLKIQKVKNVQNLKFFVNLNLISHSGKTSLLPTILICRVTLGKW